MRDRRYVAKHRGGLLCKRDHQALALWAADCAEHVLKLFEQNSDDDRPARAIEVARAWARGEVPVGTAQKAALAAHAAARSAKDPAAAAAARAAGHAVATAHMADHSFGPVIYGLKAVRIAGADFDAELAWYIKRIPARLRKLVVSADKFRLACKLSNPAGPAAAREKAGCPILPKRFYLREKRR